MSVMPTSIEHTATPPPVVLMQLLLQAWKPRAICVATQLHLAEALTDGPRTVAELAEAVGADAPSLHQLMRALARIGIFTQVDESRFANSELSHLLRPDFPESLYGMATMTTDLMWPVWGELLHSVQTGESGFNKVYGMSVWRYYVERDPVARTLLNKAMNNFSSVVNLAVAQAADLSGVRTVVDVGGGYGGLLTTLLATHPSIEKGILFDQPHVIDEARTVLDPALGGRVQLAGGDFFTAVPAGADAYVMQYVLHDWDDAACHELLATCRHAMAPQSRLLAAEIVIDPDLSDESAHGMDLQVLVMLGGRERTAAEFQALYDAAGLHLTRIIPTASMLSLIEGIPRDDED